MSRERRRPPDIRWRAVLTGGAVAVGVILGLFVIDPALSARAAPAAIAVGALVSGRMAPEAGGLHGGLVAALWIGAEAVASPLLPSESDVLADTALTILSDVLTVALAVGAGWLGARWRRL